MKVSWKKLCNAFTAALLIHSAGAATDCLASQMIVGADIAIHDITDFYYTYSTSTARPHYQRYRFYVDGQQPMFYHETREGGGWPQTEKDITAAGSRKLSDAEWAEFFDCVKGGTVKNREEHLESGSSGPWLYLYWKGDRGQCQEFSFASPADRFSFENFCVKLRQAQ
ncbi:MAG: hypothetical protein J6I40_05425 [Mailhella sp.]|nr:hypothetical protein [Mailhella sp.]